MGCFHFARSEHAASLSDSEGLPRSVEQEVRDISPKTPPKFDGAWGVEALLREGVADGRLSLLSALYNKIN